MNFKRINCRLKKLERVLTPPDDGTFTLEELCRTIWRTSRSDLLKLARDTGLGFFAAQFEREDAARDQLARLRRATGDRR